MITHKSELYLKCWEEFEQQVAKFDALSLKKSQEVLFRGQANAQWRLETSLERRFKDKCLVADYLKLVRRIKPAIETFTDAAFQMPENGAIEEVCSSNDLFLFYDFVLSAITYLAHLRHNAFPSPLLDWTSSPYVAAYIAFARADPSKDVAIYAFHERPTQIGMKVQGSNEPKIFSVGPIIKTHRRHFRQQSRYTFCAMHDSTGQWMFIPHEDVFGSSDRTEQDFLWKMTIPGKERRKVLQHFDKFNLNEFTLFESEESLLEMLAMREFDLKGAN